jgi:DNA-binding MarR family transcriptional regulator
MKDRTKQNARRLDELMAPMMQLMHRFTAQMSKCEDFTMAQHRALMMVYHAGIMTIKQFQENLSVAQSTASETLERLVKLGWLKKSKDSKDRRITVFSLTGKADRFRKEKEAARVRILEKVLEPLSKEEQQKFLESFEMLLSKHKRSEKNADAKGCHGKRKE